MKNEKLAIERQPAHSPHRLFVRGGVSEGWPNGSFPIYHLQEEKTGAARGCSPTWTGFNQRDVAVAEEIVRRWNAHLALVSALQRFMDLGTIDDQEAIDAARAALAQSKG